MEKFDLNRALAGEPIVDSQGRQYAYFCLKHPNSTLPYMAHEGKETWSFNENGECLGASSRNLFMKHSKQTTMKPFDLEKAKKGADLMTKEGDIGQYLYTMDRTEGGSDQKHILIFRSTEGNEYPIIVNDEGIGEYAHTKTRTTVSMAPKKVKYYFASWNDRYQPGERESLKPVKNLEILEKRIEEHNLRDAIGFAYHEFEIEE